MINTRRNLKYKKLLNNLKDKFSKDLNLSNVKLRIKNKISISKYDISFARTSYNRFTRVITAQSLNLNIQGAKNRAVNGYSNGYYRGRDKKLSFVLHNRKLSRNFIIAHELAHFYLLKKDLNKGIDIYNTEFNADRLAIALLKKYKLLKESNNE